MLVRCGRGGAMEVLKEESQTACEKAECGLERDMTRTLAQNKYSVITMCGSSCQSSPIFFYVGHPSLGFNHHF